MLTTPERARGVRAIVSYNEQARCLSYGATEFVHQLNVRPEIVHRASNPAYNLAALCAPCAKQLAQGFQCKCSQLADGCATVHAFSRGFATCTPALSAADALMWVGPRHSTRVLRHGGPCAAFQRFGFGKRLARDRVGFNAPRHDDVEAQTAEDRVGGHDLRRSAMCAALHGESSAPICLGYSIIFGNRTTRERCLSRRPCHRVS